MAPEGGARQEQGGIHLVGAGIRQPGCSPDLADQNSPEVFYFEKETEPDADFSAQGNCFCVEGRGTLQNNAAAGNRFSGETGQKDQDDKAFQTLKRGWRQRGGRQGVTGNEESAQVLNLRILNIRC